MCEHNAKLKYSELITCIINLRTRGAINDKVIDYISSGEIYGEKMPKYIDNHLKKVLVILSLLKLNKTTKAYRDMKGEELTSDINLCNRVLSSVSLPILALVVYHLVKCINLEIMMERITAMAESDVGFTNGMYIESADLMKVLYNIKSICGTHCLLHKTTYVDDVDDVDSS